MRRRERRRGGRGDRAKEEAASGWRHRRWLHWHRRRETLQFLLFLFFTDFRGPRLFFFEPSAFIALIILSGRLGGRELNLMTFPNFQSGSGHGEKVFWGGGGAAAGKCATRIPGVSYERDKCGKDL